MDLLTISRFQFGSTAAFHILWPIMSIGIGLFIAFFETLWYATGRDEYYRQVRFWLKIFVLTFAIGVASGLPLSLQFGTNWSEFAKMAGSYFGNLLGFETTVAFTLESAFLGLMVFGWGKISKKVHLLSSYIVMFAASLSAFWIMAANSWMQAPLGVHFENNLVVVDSYKEAILNGPTIVSFFHMWFACVQSSMFLIAGISALALLARGITKERSAFFAQSFKYSIAIGLVSAVLQFGVGDMSGLIIAKYQPAKLAATELHWNTNAPGTGAPWALVAWPNKTNDGNSFSVEIPNALSGLTTHSMTGTVQGLNDFAPNDRPTRVDNILVFYAFRLMVALGTAMILLGLLGVWYWKRGKLEAEILVSQRKFLWLWVYAMPFGFIATEAGWMVREIGRQPWAIYHVLRVSDSMSSGLQAPILVGVIVGIVALYAVAIGGFIIFTTKIVKKGPDFTSPIPWAPKQN